MSVIKKLAKLLIESNLLKEGFGFDYKFPQDKNKAIYDFYALSLIDTEKLLTAKYETGYKGQEVPSWLGTAPGEIVSQDEDLKFSLEQAIITSLNGMRDFMLETLRRAVSAEIVHFQPIWNDRILYSTTPTNKAVFKKIQKMINPESVDYFRASLPGYDTRYEKMLKLKIKDKDFFTFAADAFSQEKSSWHASYGGKAWQKIAEGALQLSDTTKVSENYKDKYTSSEAKNRKEIIDAVDHTIDLAHNTGAVFTKWPEAAVSKVTLENKKIHK